MDTFIQDIPIVFIGAGNLATNLAKAFYRSGFRIIQVYSRTQASAAALADAVEAAFTTELSQIRDDAALYVVSLKDDALIELLPDIVGIKIRGLLVHTAGSIPMNIFKDRTGRYGVFYPMQTFSKQREVDFKSIPIFVESNSAEDTYMLRTVASILSEKVYEATSEQRKCLHLSAVFTCNFANHMYALAAELLNKYNLPFEVMLPLIDETAEKVHQLTPAQAQTGPAIRFDRNVMDKHLDMLSDEPGFMEIYKLLSESIYRLANKGSSANRHN